MKTEQEQQQILSELDNNTCTEHYNIIPFSKIKYTDGINALINKCGCWWLISDTAIFMSAQKSNILRGEEFLVLTIKVNEDKSAVVTLKEDTDEKPVYSKKYSYTDFPLNEFEFYVIGGIMLLKSEY